MKSVHASLAIAVAAVAATSSLRAQNPAPEPGATPLSAPAESAPTPVSTDPNSMVKAVEAPKKEKEKERPVRKAVLEKYDKNKNGVLEPEERTQFERDAPARKAERLKKYDKNGDGKLDESERVAMKVERLREADAAKKAEKK